MHVYLQVCVSLRQQTLDLFGHGAEHQLQVCTFILHQLVPAERQHHARILSHLQQGQVYQLPMIRSMGVWENLTQNGRYGDKQSSQCEGCVNTKQRKIK